MIHSHVRVIHFTDASTHQGAKEARIQPKHKAATERLTQAQEGKTCATAIHISLLPH